mmetsp:Transcript_711/g.2527  ORF Transcript_711/g.2527 Transcript_711/m.2527 type:complete len:565 (-) Transcript_711:40-1734(-)
MFNKKKLYNAVKEGNHEKVLKLAKKSHAMHSDEAGYNSFTHAALLGNAKVVQALLDAGVNPNIRDKKDRTPLFVAALCDRGEVAKALVNFESDPPIEIDAKCGDSQKTALEVAIESESNSVVNVLGKVAGQWLLQAAKENDAPKVRELLKRPGLNPDVTDITGWTALHFAMKNGNEFTVEDLAAAGADAHVKNRKGETPIDIATELGNMAIVKEFERIFNITGKKTREEMEEHFKEHEGPAVGIVPQHLQQEFVKEAQRKKKESPAPKPVTPLSVSVKGGWAKGAPTVGIDEELARELAAMGIDLAKSPRQSPRSPRPEVPQKPAQLSPRPAGDKPAMPAKLSHDKEAAMKKSAEAAAGAAAAKKEEATKEEAKKEEAKKMEAKKEEAKAAPAPAAAATVPKVATGGLKRSLAASSGGGGRTSPRRAAPASPRRTAASPRNGAPASPRKIVSPRVVKAPTEAAPPVPTSPRTVKVDGAAAEMPVELAITDSLMSLYGLEEQLTKLEEKNDKQLLTQTIKQVRSLAINLKNFSALEECKSGENADNMARLRDGIKAAVARIKGLS